MTIRTPINLGPVVVTNQADSSIGFGTPKAASGAGSSLLAVGFTTAAAGAGTPTSSSSVSQLV
jgi:acyl dehydratase